MLNTHRPRQIIMSMWVQWGQQVQLKTHTHTHTHETNSSSNVEHSPSWPDRHAHVSTARWWSVAEWTPRQLPAPPPASCRFGASRRWACWDAWQRRAGARWAPSWRSWLHAQEDPESRQRGSRCVTGPVNRMETYICCIQVLPILLSTCISRGIKRILVKKSMHTDWNVGQKVSSQRWIYRILIANYKSALTTVPNNRVMLTASPQPPSPPNTHAHTMGFFLGWVLFHSCVHFRNILLSILMELS